MITVKKQQEEKQLDKKMLDDYEALLEKQDKKRQIEWNERVERVQKKMQLMADGVVKSRSNVERE